MKFNVKEERDLYVSLKGNLNMWSRVVMMEDGGRQAFTDEAELNLVMTMSSFRSQSPEKVENMRTCFRTSCFGFRTRSTLAEEAEQPTCFLLLSAISSIILD